jgi:hypothetical protein
MAKRRPTPKDVPDAVRDAVDRTVQATIGSAQLTRGRAQEAVDELVRTAEAGAGAVREAVVGAFEERRPATSDDLKELRTELRRILRRLTAIERQLGDGGGPSPAGPGAAASDPKRSGPSATASRSKPARGAAKGSGGRRADAGGGGGGGPSGAARGGSSGGASRGS